MKASGQRAFLADLIAIERHAIDTVRSGEQACFLELAAQVGLAKDLCHDGREEWLELEVLDQGRGTVGGDMLGVLRRDVGQRHKGQAATLRDASSAERRGVRFLQTTPR